jgi:cyanophycinase
MKNAYFIFAVTFCIISCKNDLSIMSSANSQKLTSSTLKNAKNSAAVPKVVTYLTGDQADVNTLAQPGLILMGGGTDVDEAINWFLQRSGGGDIVVIRATGADGYNTYMYNMANVNSVETIIIDSRTKAGLIEVEQKIRNAEALFIAGGDQWDYVNFWKDTPVENAINYLINTKQVTVGGTSAGLAILGSAYFSASAGTVTSAQALANPYNKSMTLGQNNFIASTLLQNTITDSHYTQRDRQGRHITFLAKLMKDFGNAAVKGIGIDEQTAVCIDENGIGKVYGINQAYFLQNNTLGAETCLNRTPLSWIRGNQAVKAYKITGSSIGNGSFNANTWALSGGINFYYYVNNGLLVQN